MPELPEVETVRQTLMHQIIGEKIKNVKILYTPIIENEDPKVFCEKLIGEKIESIDRYGKYLIFILSNCSIISHLRMEGKYFLKHTDEPIVKHEHVIFTFESGLTLRYHDTRKFGKMAIVYSTKKEDIMMYPALKKLGPEANTNNLTADYLYNTLIKKNEAIKSALLNQEVLAGLGNIYVDEVCFMCKLNPNMSCKKITMNDCENIVKACHEVLGKAIEAGGTTIRSYTCSLGVTGRFQLSLNVHTLDGKPCPICKTIILKTVVGGRGTYFCPTCQKDRRPTVIGLTGGIATGKTAVKNYLLKEGYVVLDSDEIVKKLYNNKNVINKIKDTFGNEFIDDNNQVKRNELGMLIYHDKEKRVALDNLIHPLVRSEIEKQIMASLDKTIIIDVPLLYEASFDDLCDKVIVVTTDLETNIKRLIARDNIDYEYALTKINSQMPLVEKCQKADFIIDNSQDLCYTYKQIDEMRKEF